LNLRHLFLHFLNLFEHSCHIWEAGHGFPLHPREQMEKISKKDTGFGQESQI
jgi:hypothetical protein